MVRPYASSSTVRMTAGSCSTHRRFEKDRDLRPTPFADLTARDPGLVLVADLPIGWLAWRAARGGAWARSPISDAYHRVDQRGKTDASAEFVFMVLDHEPGWLERLCSV